MFNTVTHIRVVFYDTIFPGDLWIKNKDPLLVNSWLETIYNQYIFHLFLHTRFEKKAYVWVRNNLLNFIKVKYTILNYE